MVAEKQLIQMAVESNAKYIPNHVPLDKWHALPSWEPQHCSLPIQAHLKLLLLSKNNKGPTSEKGLKKSSPLSQNIA